MLPFLSGQWGRRGALAQKSSRQSEQLWEKYKFGDKVQLSQNCMDSTDVYSWDLFPGQEGTLGFFLEYS